MQQLAPIVLFVFDRPQHTRRVLEALAGNELAQDSKLFIYADGPKQAESEREKYNIKTTRQIIRERQWCSEVVIREEPVNRGLANSIVSGVTEVVNQFGKVIVLEDDLLPSHGFLKYMNEALNVYEGNEKVMHISAYMYPIAKRLDDGTVFLRVLSCWGWATWARAWRHLSLDVNKHIQDLESSSQIKRFNVLGHAPFYGQLIHNQQGRINSWAVKWYASWFLRGGYALFPKTTLITNIGHDGTGVHSVRTSEYDPHIVANYIRVEPQVVVEDLNFLKRVDSFYLGLAGASAQSIPKRIYSKMRHWIASVIRPGLIKK
jgi:hypothetical protein